VVGLEREEQGVKDVISSARVVWDGTVARGGGTVSGERGVLADVPFDLPTRIGEETVGKTTPEELLASAHAACFAMSLGGILARRRTPPERLEVTSRVTLALSGERPAIPRIDVEVAVSAPGVDESTLAELLDEAERGCLISRTLRNGTVDVAPTGSLVAA
jgi:osmotically inducible protein OsmC